MRKYCVLTARTVSGRGLANKDTLSKSDPCCIVSQRERERKRERGREGEKRRERARREGERRRERARREGESAAD